MLKEKVGFYHVCFAIFWFFSNFANCLGLFPTKECLVNLYKNKNNAKKTKHRECAVYDIQHTLLRLPYYGKHP